MNQLVKIIRDDDGDETGDASWHLVDPCNPLGETVLCTKEFFGQGESSKFEAGGEDCVQFETKSVPHGGITCKNCLAILKAYKAVKL